MIAILTTVIGTLLAKSSGADEVTLGELEERLRSLTNGARDVVMSSKRNAIAAGALGAVMTVAGAYLHGRRRGRRRATVLEVERT